MATVLRDDRHLRPGKEPSRTELLNQLERIVASNHFRNSKRYPSFLRFIVERTVEENTEVLKERNLGTEIFGRPSDYDTGSDPIVRVTAGEVRKRIAQYYQTAGHEHELRIDLPLGSYVPQFYPVPPASETEGHDQPEAATAETSMAASAADEVIGPVVARKPAKSSSSRPATRNKRLRSLGFYALAGVVVIAGAFLAASMIRSRSRTSGTDYFWQALTPGNNVLIAIGVHFTDSNGKSLPIEGGGGFVRNEQESALYSMLNSDMVPVSDVISYSRFTDQLTRRSISYQTKSSAEATLEQLRTGPVILIGGFDNLWTMRLAESLRYRFRRLGENVNEIQDSEHPATAWVFDNLQPAMHDSRDYAIVASYFDPTIEQHVLIAAGIGKNGTTAASEFLTSEKDLKNWLAETKLPPNKNVELVLSTEVLDGEPGPPHVIAYSAW